MAQEGLVISWDVHSHAHKERSADWFWGLGLGVVAGAAVSIFLGNVLLAVILVIGAMSLAILAARGPRQHSVRIDVRGISVDGTLYRFDTIRSFWVDEARENMSEKKSGPHLYFSTTGIVAPHFTLPLESRAQGEQIRSFLKKYVDEEEQGPHFSEHITEIFGL